MTPTTTPAPRENGYLKIVLTVFLPFAGGYFLSYLFRSVNAVVAPDLVADVGLSASDLGLLTSAYFLAFAAAQLPLGVLLDRFGPRRVQSCLLLSAALGATVFGLGEDRETLIVGRALIGLGVAGGLMASFKAIVLWFPRERLPLANGCFMAFGGMGAVTATSPVEALLHVTEWRGLFIGLAVLTCAASAAIFLIVPERAPGGPVTTLREQILGLKRIYGDRLFWRLAPLNCAVSATAFSLQGLWAGPWLRDVAGLDRIAVADHLFALTLALTFGMVGAGVVADLARRFGITLIAVIGGGVLIFMLTQVAIILEATAWAVMIWAVFGLFSNANALTFALLSQHFPAEYSARANTGLNVLLFSFAFVAQYLVGTVIDLWPTSTEGHYAPEGYQAAFGILLAIQVVAYLWFLASGRRRKVI